MRTILLFLCLQVFHDPVIAQSLIVREKHFNTIGKVAIKEFDVISYFDGKPVKGNKELVHSFEGITYHFSSQRNLNLFISDSKKFEPAYGGWCAYAMGNDGSKVEIDPETFKIINGKLYLFYNFYFSNTLKKWNMDEDGLKSRADKNWSIIISK